MNKPTIIEGMEIYEKIEDIPYQLLMPGGDFNVFTVPSEMETEGLGMGVVAENGEVLFPGGLPDPTWPIWILILIEFRSLILKTLCVVAVLAAINIVAGNIIYQIRVIPEGQVLDILEDGTRVFQAADGSTWLLHTDGTSEKVAGPPPSFEAVLIAATVAIIVIAVVIFTWKSGIFTKKKDKT